MVKFPQNPVDSQIITINGEQYRYYSILNQWVQLGGAPEAQLTTSFQNGIITPELAALLDVLPSGISFKLYPNDSAYFYLLRCANRLFEFAVEGADLRIELNRNVTANLLLSAACSGPRGLPGPIGDSGDDGDPGPSETLLVPDIAESTISIRTILLTPLETDISVRLYRRTGSDNIELHYNLQTGNTTVVAATRQISTQISVVDGYIDFTAVSSAPWESDWLIKIRQRGPDGWSGTDGINFIGIASANVYALRASNVIAGLRNSGENLYFIREDIGNIAASRLRPCGDDLCGPIYSDNDILVSTGPGLDNNKSLLRWQWEGRKNTTNTDLNLPVWSPDPSCVNWGSFEWWKSTDCSADFVVADPLPTQCCQEDFFFCPNLSDICGIVSAASDADIAWNINPPTPPVP